MDEPSAAISAATEWLADPLKHGLDAAIGRSAELCDLLKLAVREDPKGARQAGPLIGEVSRWQTRLARVEMLDWVPLAGGYASVGHRPSAQLVEDLAIQQCTHIFTLLSEGEGATNTRDQARRAGLEWVWFPMVSANAPGSDRTVELRRCFDEISSALSAGGRVYVHCSAGIHRTGMISFALLRYLGLPEQSALEKLEELRPTTAAGVGADRIAWGESVSELL